MSVVADVLTWAFLLAGAFFTLIGGIGVLRMPDLFARLHASGVSDMLGAGFVMVGLMFQTGWSLAKLVIVWLTAAFMAEYFLKLYLPEDALTAFVGRDNPFAVPVAAIVGAPLYLDGYAALPFVRGLMDRGMADGAAMAFLIAGGIISAWAAIPVFALFRLPVFLAYVILAVMGSMLAGWGYALAMA